MQQFLYILKKILFIGLSIFILVFVDKMSIPIFSANKNIVEDSYEEGYQDAMNEFENKIDENAIHTDSYQQGAIDMFYYFADNFASDLPSERQQEFWELESQFY